MGAAGAPSTYNFGTAFVGQQVMDQRRKNHFDLGTLINVIL